ncbi:phage shock protein A (PspA) family protein [Filimonas lacunae]|uniref:Phage shock protein A (PspA) family protein n=1 Tax=Filimonas lacunae TaxID=477680 RepID=A0A173MBY9_9BACT|nr:PspA/IM30 family protein [Filimonas lacunae]BAV04971.1 phage shock protein A [Filimonas lacunae]SIT33714.1 phage shock protein A (PspA) family protein [Filimonas lacunae]
MNIFKRLFRIGQAEIHAAVEKMEDPIKMTEQGLRELRKDLADATEAYASVRALAIRTENEQAACEKESLGYAEKAVLVMQKAQTGQVDIVKAEQLAREALSLRRKYYAESEELGVQVLALQNSSQEMLRNTEVLKENLEKWEKELRTLKMRVKVSTATQQVNKQLAQLDTNGTIAMLERMRAKVEDQEALSMAYGEIAHSKNSLQSELNNILKDDSFSIEKDLKAIKEKLGINDNPS